MFNTKFVRIIIALVIAVVIFPIQTSHAARWGGASNLFLAFGHLVKDRVCRDGMTVAVIRYRVKDPPFVFDASLELEFLLASGNSERIRFATQVITVTTVRQRYPLWADLDISDRADRSPFFYYTIQNVFWSQPLEPGMQVVLQAKDEGGAIRETDPVAVSDCYLSERNRTAAERDMLAGLLPTGDATTDRRIQKAVHTLDQSLAPELWQVDGLHLTENGKTVFNEFSRAVRQLMNIVHPADVVEHTIITLPDVACVLAQTAIEDAIMAGGDADAIAKAEAAVKQGWVQLFSDDFRGAIRQFKLAWLHAQRAMGRWSDEINETMEELVLSEEE